MHYIKVHTQIHTYNSKTTARVFINLELAKFIYNDLLKSCVLALRNEKFLFGNDNDKCCLWEIYKAGRSAH